MRDGNASGCMDLEGPICNGNVGSDPCEHLRPGSGTRNWIRCGFRIGTHDRGCRPLGPRPGHPAQGHARSEERRLLSFSYRGKGRGLAPPLFRLKFPVCCQFVGAGKGRMVNVSKRGAMLKKLASKTGWPWGPIPMKPDSPSGKKLSSLTTPDGPYSTQWP